MTNTGQMTRLKLFKTVYRWHYADRSIGTNGYHEFTENIVAEDVSVVVRDLERQHRSVSSNRLEILEVSQTAIVSKVCSAQRKKSKV